MRWMRRLFLASASVAALTTLSAGSATAQVAWTGTTSTDWTIGTNWSGGAPPTNADAVNISTTSPNPTVLGVGGPAVGTTGLMIVGDTIGSIGNLTIQNGSTLTSSSIAAAPFEIGSDPGSNGTVTVTGAGSQWITSGAQISVGAGGSGTLNIQNGAVVVAQSGVTLGAFAGGTGTLNINGGSTLETNSLGRAATGAGQVNFDNAILRARINNAVGFVAGFLPGTLNIAAGGLTIDTQAFTVGASSTFSGVGGLTKIGAGTLNLRALNTYTGETEIQTGTLSLVSSGSIAASSRVVADGTFNISGVTAAGTSIQSLAGSGAVTLGAKNLTITNANDLFSGTISGTGALTLTGGTETLTGDNSGFGGSTTVQAGTLAVNGILGGPMDVLSGGRLQGIGQVATTTNAGTIAPGNSIGTLTIAGNYTGNGGILEIESVLGGDASPSDRLVVAGDTAGSTTVRVINLGGAGAPTVEGIKVVDVAGASNGSFTLQGNYVFNGQQAVVGGLCIYASEEWHRDPGRRRLVSALEPDQPARLHAGRSALSGGRAHL
jgi:T5SS/PEP-CTERM-associated repeat protein/autotransporter-associated beta strand protein